MGYLQTISTNAKIIPVSFLLSTLGGSLCRQRGMGNPVLQLHRGTIATLLLNVPQTFFRSHKSITFVRDMLPAFTYCIRFAVNRGEGPVSPTQDSVCAKSMPYVIQ